MAYGCGEITLWIDGQSASVGRGMTLAQALAAAGAAADSPCGGRGTCGRCVIRIDTHCPPPTTEDRKHLSGPALAQGLRLACQHTPEENMAVSVVTGAVECRLITHQDGASEWSSSLEKWAPDGWLLSSPHSNDSGIALDLGTTTITASLIHLRTGVEIKTATMTNPQIPFGADIISRLAAASQGQAHLLRRVLITGVTHLIHYLVRDLCCAGEAVAAITMVGNTAMHHLFLGLPVQGLGTAPYRPTTVDSQLMPAVGAGLSNLPNAVLFSPPLVWGFVGSDVTAGMLATSLDAQDGISLLLDMGTNSEIVGHYRGRLVACAAAAGPAFEGAHTSCGMRAAPGAITRVYLSPEPRIECIGEGRPRGLSGSGTLDLLAEALRWGLIDSSGRIVIDPPRRVASLLTEHPSGELVIEIAPGIGLTQNDVRQLQMAKGAICAGVQTVLTHLGGAAPEVNRVFLAGAFGSNMDPTSAVRVGMFGDIRKGVAVSVGNSAAKGARLALLSSSARDRLQQYGERTEYLELAAVPGFQRAYVDSLSFPEARVRRSARTRARHVGAPPTAK